MTTPDEPRTPARRVTIYDVAREAGVAPSTVSRAISRPGRINSDTVQRVLEAAQRVGYRNERGPVTPHVEAHALLGLVVADVTNPYFFDVIRGAEHVAQRAGYTLLVADAHESGDAERRAVDRISPLVDGLAFATSRMTHTSIRASTRGQPTVILNRVLPDMPSLLPDNLDGMRQVIDHLAALGHREIAFVAGPEASWADGIRFRGLFEHGGAVGIRITRVGPYPPTMAAGMAAVRPILATTATAAVAFNDLLAIGVLRGMQQAGLSVPDDLSVVGFDNIFGADFCSPPLTTVAAPLRQLGASAIEMLLAQITPASVVARPRAPLPERPQVLPVHLVVRESTGPARPRT